MLALSGMMTSTCRVRFNADSVAPSIKPRSSSSKSPGRNTGACSSKGRHNPFKYFFVFSCPYRLSPDDAEALYARTGSVDEWRDLWPHSSQVRINTLGTEHVPLARALAHMPPKGPAPAMCWWLRDAWDPLAPNDLLSVSAARPPSTQSCMRSEAPGEAQG